MIKEAQGATMTEVPVTPPEPHPLSWEGLLSLGPIIVLAAIGGFVNWIRKVNAGETKSFNLVELIGELVISGFAGVLFFWLIHGLKINPYVEAATIGIAGHAGSRAIFLLEKWLESRVNAISFTTKKDA